VAEAFDLDTAIARNQLVLEYQPIVSLGAGGLGAVAGVEALLRWRRPEGLVQPFAFLAGAEADETTIRRLTAWVLKESLQQATVWRSDGIDLPVSVNLASANVRDPAFPRFLELTLRGTRAGDRLIADVAATSIVGDVAPIRAAIVLMRSHGITVALDDVHTDAAFPDVPLDLVKVGRRVIGGVTTEIETAALLQRIVIRAHAAKLRVVAVGAEDQATVDRVAEIGCDLAQGYVIGRPMPPAELDRWLRGRQGARGAQQTRETMDR